MFENIKWSRGDKVLEFGGGTGYNAYKWILPQVQKWEGDLVSLDISNTMVEYARKTWPHPRIQHICADILAEDDKLEKQLDGRLFDKIFSTFVLHQVHDIRNTLCRLQGLLNPGGVFGFICFTNKNFYFRATRIIAQMEKWKECFNGYESIIASWTTFEGKDHGENMLRNLMHECGFQVKTLEILDRSCYFDDIEVFLDLLLAINQFLHRLPEKKKQELKNDYHKLLTEIEETNTDSKDFMFKYELLYAVIEKPEVF
ncbi:unnamed protein product [Orchesella dallaii]|uniref:Methyltransferase type 12 domain-containing protein n=1 Tax=Orchesella dallaii TaxID=48710 RepID=A0ABP1QQR0_9HEXA